MVDHLFLGCVFSLLMVRSSCYLAQLAEPGVWSACARQREVIWSLETANKRTFRAFQLKEKPRDIFALVLIQARAALDSRLYCASRSKLTPVREAGPHHPHLQVVDGSHHRMAAHQRHCRVQ